MLQILITEIKVNNENNQAKTDVVSKNIQSSVPELRPSNPTHFGSFLSFVYGYFSETQLSYLVGNFHLKLPKYTLLKFLENITEWNLFWQLFLLGRFRS